MLFLNYPEAVYNRITLCSKHFLHGIAWNGIEEEKYENRQTEYDESFDYPPLVIVPDDVAYGFQWVQEPHERCIWATEMEGRQ